MTFSARALALAVALGRRALDGRYWVEFEGTVAHRTPIEGVEGTAAGVADPDVLTADDGIGPLYVRSYTVDIEDSQCSGTDLIEHLRRAPNDFAPNSYAVFAPEPVGGRWKAGDEVEIHLPGPWNGPVLVDDVVATDRVRLLTRDGHMEAGAIEFIAVDRPDGVVRFEIRSRARSATPAFDAVYSLARIGKLIQSQMWAQFLEAAVIVAGGRQRGRIRMRTITVEDDR